MSDNPLEESPERDARIRELAHRLWEEDGKPHGQDLEFWVRAEELIGMEEHPQAGLLPNPMTADPKPVADVEEADIQDNLGEFPSLMTDQGDREQTPKRHRPD
jgi:hypothetical protein